MPSRLSCLIAATTLFIPTAAAHDFWIEPESYTPEPGEATGLDILTGHGEDTADWPLAPHRVIGLRSLGPDGLVSHAAGAESLTGAVSPSFESPGLHMIFIETANSFSALAAKEFNDYVEEEGVRPIAAARAAGRTQDTEGRELYSRRGKALVKAGCAAAEGNIWAQELGLSLEITALENPFAWEDGKSLNMKVFFHGAPVPSAMLHVTALEGEGEDFTVTTGADGTADLGENLAEGRWLVHTVWSEAAPNLLEEADYQTVFSSLTFETDDGCAG